MKIVGKSVSLVAFVLTVGILSSVTGQVLRKPAGKPEVRAESDGRHVFLKPQQELEMVEVTGGCITFLTEVRFNVPLPFGNTVEIALPPGSRWPIPAGKYKLDNPTNAPIEYVLKKGTTCRDLSPK
jgi:hypothetical protein